MHYRIFLLSLLAASSTSLLAEEVPALVIGGGTKVALHEVTSVTFDARQLHVHKTDGTTLTESLQALTFGTTDTSAGIAEVLASDVSGRYAIYTLDGRLVRQGVARSQQECLVGLEAGTYVVRIGDKRFKVQTAGLVPVADPCSAAEASFVPVATRASAAVAAPTAMQIGVPGVDPQLALSRVESIAFSSDLTFLYVNETAGTGNAFMRSSVASISFPELAETVSIQYAGQEVDGVNPFYFDGVMIRTDGAGVSVSNLSYFEEVEYLLSGASTDGYFRINSDYKWKATMMGLNLTNPVGPVINSQTGKKGTLKSPNGYVNTLCDGVTYATATEDQKAAIFSEGQLIFSGKGTLNVTSLNRHAICSDDYVSFDNGTVNVLGAVGDAVHAKDSVIVQSGTVTLSPSSDGIDCDGPVTIRRGENGSPVLCITTVGDGAKGIKTGKHFLMTDGNVRIDQSGKSEVKDGDTSRVIGIKAAGNITISGGTLVINNTAEGGKGLSADGTINTNGADVTIVP